MRSPPCSTTRSRTRGARPPASRSAAAIVDGCSDAETLPKPPWRERKEAYVAHIAHASPSVRLVSAADKLHNARSILADYRQALWGRFNGGRNGTLWYYRALADAFRDAGSMPLVEELDRTVSELERLAGVRPPTDPDPGPTMP